LSDKKQVQELETKVFVRESTGLVKNVSFLHSITLNFSNMSVGALLGSIGFNMAFLPTVLGVNLVLASVIGLLLSVPQIIIYTMMTTRYPRTGGDYVWISRTLGGFAGNVLAFTGYTLETMAFIALVVLGAVNAIGVVGAIPSIAAPPDVPGTSPVMIFGSAVLLFGALIAINIFKPKWGYRVVTILALFGIAALAVAILTLLGAGHQSVVQYINNLQAKDVLGSGKPITYSSLTSAYTGPAFSFAATLLIMPAIFGFVYPWVNAGPAVASEIKGRRALKWNVPVSALLVFITLTAALATWYFVAGQDLVNEGLANFSLVAVYNFNFWTLAMGVANNQFVSAVIGLGWIALNVATVAYAIIVVSRYLLAQSFDRYLPSKVSYVSPRFGSPVIAHIIDLVVTIALIGMAVLFYSGYASLYGAIIASMVYFAFVGLAAAVHAARRERGFSRFLLVICGIANIIVFSYITSEYLQYPETWEINPLTYTFVMLSALVSVAIYLFSKMYHESKGIDISLAFKELPPE
jgi:amino acid transporter